MAKKVLPIYLDEKDRRILQALAEQNGCSMGEAARRIIRSYRLEAKQEPRVLPPGDALTENAH